jgi:hypothetical protein
VPFAASTVRSGYGFASVGSFLIRTPLTTPFPEQEGVKVSMIRTILALILILIATLAPAST